MKRLIYSICILAISISTIYAQNNPDAEKVITNLISVAKSKAIKTNFTLVVSEKKSINLQQSSGTFIIKDNKFILEMPDMKAWFNGKTQWAYVVQNNEVSITEPTEEELAQVNPISILSGLKNRSNIQFAKTNIKENYTVIMTPKQKSDIKNIEVQVNKKTGNLVSLKLSNTNNSTTTLNLSNYQTGINISNSEFEFNSKKFKDVIINDLR